MPDEAPAPAAPTPPPSREFPPAEPAPELPAEEPSPAPSLEPEAPALPTDTLEMPPAAEPAAPSGADDLFNNTTPAPTEPAPAEPKADSTDDLFKETSEPAAPAVDPAAEPKKQEVDDLFSDPAPADKSTSTDPNGMREWTDNTGHYHVVARLVSVSKTHVRLFKENGRYTTVPFERLSQADLAFVRHQATGQIASK